MKGWNRTIEELKKEIRKGLKKQGRCIREELEKVEKV